MGIKAKKENWYLGGLKIEVEKQMSKLGPRKIDTLNVHIFTPLDLTEDQLKILKDEVKGCPVLKNIQDSTNINLHWSQH